MSRRHRSGVAFRAVPDNSRLAARIGPGGTLELDLPGHWNLEFLTEPRLAQRFSDVWFCPGQELALAPGIDTVANLCAAPDACELGMRALDQALRPDMAVLNHPQAIIMTRRDLAATVFRSIKGLRVPPAVRFVTDGADTFTSVFADLDFRYPVRVSPEGAHPDEAWRIEGNPDWATLRRRPWGRRAWVMEQAEVSDTRWRMMLGIVGRSARAEVFDAGRSPTYAQPPAVAPDFVQRLTALACDCLPLDIWTLVVALEPGGPVLDRVFAGLPQPRLNARTDFDRAARRVSLGLKPAVADLLADRAAWRAWPDRSALVPTVSGKTPGRPT